MKRLSIRTSGTEDAVDLTGRLQEEAVRSGVREGALLVHCPHTTAGILINEGHDPDVIRDVRMVFGRLAPPDLPYRHGEGNSPAHLKSALAGCQVLVPIEEGRLVLGTWQRVLLMEWDGPRNREVWLTVLPGQAEADGATR